MFNCSAQVFEGHPFVVEAGVSLGGKDVKQVSLFLSVADTPFALYQLYHYHCLTLVYE